MFERMPWKPDGGKPHHLGDLAEGQLNRSMAMVIRLAWDSLPEGSRSMQKVEEKLRMIVREEAERVANTPGFLDADRLLIRHAVQSCSQFRPEHAKSADRLAWMVLSALEQELSRAKEDEERHRPGNETGI